MKEVKRFKTKTYDIGDGFLLDMITDSKEGTINFWLYHDEYGIKWYLYGYNIGIDSFYLDNPANLDSYKNEYRHRYMD